PAREHVDLLPRVAERDLGVQQRLDDPVALHEPGAGTEPVEDTTEVDEPDPVLLEEVALRERGRGADRLVERSAVASACVDETVEEEDHVGVPLGVELVDPELAAPGARAPVDPSDPVTRDELTQVGELEPLALGTRDAVAGEELRLAGRDQLAQLLGPRIAAEDGAAIERLLPDEQPRRIPGAHV